jgi:hypothetical protein
MSGILSEISQAIDALEHRFFANVTEEMKLFEHNGVGYYGFWRRWHRARTNEEREAVMSEYHELIKDK